MRVSANRIAAFFSAFVLVLMLSAGIAVSPAWADEGDGSGGGGGVDVPFEIQASYPANGAAGVSQNPGDMWIRFTHNVADPSVSQHNASLVYLVSEDGSTVSAKSWCFDAQINFDQRQYIYITPQERLKPQTTYTIVVSAGIVARNGIHQTSSTERISFTTGGTASGEEKPADRGDAGKGEASSASGGTASPSVSSESSASSDASRGESDSDSKESDVDEEGDSEGEPKADDREDPDGSAGEDSGDGTASSGASNGDDVESDAETSWMHSRVWWAVGAIALVLAAALAAVAAVRLRRNSGKSGGDNDRL